MQSLVLDNSALVRLLTFLVAVSVFAFWEMLSPRRILSVSKAVRWVNNWLLTALNSMLLLLVFPVMAVGVSLLAAEKQRGLFNLFVLPQSVANLHFVLLFDLAK